LHDARNKSTEVNRGRDRGGIVCVVIGVCICVSVRVGVSIGISI